ncbi:MAG: hypothetical protein HC881_22475 [Leptolyngbyaceae cyanobacterium SL_7_1]|nr:hypothetical protein [Leptolyngbyaceae cyanobacterium SL_7_1]
MSNLDTALTELLPLTAQQSIDSSPISKKPLKPNPFVTYRDPKSGHWVVVKTTAYQSFS